MSRHVSRHKLSRKELVQKDEITERLERGAEYVWDNPRPFLWGAAILVVGAVVLGGWTIYAARRDAAGQVALASVIQTYNDSFALSSDEARYQATIIAARQVEQDYGNSPAGQAARYYRALSHQGLGEVSEAVGILEDLAATAAPALRPVAQFALGQAFKSQGDFDQAIDVYSELLASGDYAPEVLVFELAQLNEAVDRVEEARTLYESLLNDYPGSVYEPDAERALKRIDTARPGSA